ncbi:MAG: hypothetical protein HY084_04180 [Gemmatimonadetes bacterium]|nr:hypothetical protein [Gemmatimonadota bacterium]
MGQLSSFDQINLGATFLQLAVIVAFAVAVIGVWYTSRRPVMRPLAGYWALLAVASLVNVGSSWTGAMLHDRPLSLTLTTVVVALHGAAIAFARAALESLGVLEGPPAKARGALRTGLAVLALHGVGVIWLFRAMPLDRRGVVLWSRSVHFLVLLVPAVLAWRAVARAKHTRAPMRLLAIGWTAIAARAAIEIGFGFDVGGGALPVDVVLGAIVVNVLAMMVLGVTALVAASREESDLLQRESTLLQQTQRRLARVKRIESLGRLAVGIAHDFSNVLTVAQLAATEGQRNPDSARKDEALREVRLASDRGRELVQQLLTFARQQSDDVERFDASDRVEAMSTILSRLTGTVTYAFEPSPEPTAVRMDPSQFDQIVLNLVTNARDSMPAGGRVAVSVSSSEQSAENPSADVPPGSYVRVRVEDTGEGIPAEVLPHIFEPFFSTKDDRGTGLGLATVRSIVQRAAGDITVRTTPGKGTVFEVFLPVAPLGT